MADVKADPATEAGRVSPDAARANAESLSGALAEGHVPVSPSHGGLVVTALLGFEGRTADGPRLFSLIRIEDGRTSGRSRELLAAVDVASGRADDTFAWSDEGGDGDSVEAGRIGAARLFSPDDDGMPAATALLDRAFGLLREAIEARMGYWAEGDGEGRDAADP